MTAQEKLKNWESKDRVYEIKGTAPLTYKIKSRGLLWFDEESGENREIRYSANQKSLFVDEQDGKVMLSHVVFENGHLYVPRTNPLLQKLLSIYHPKLNSLYRELNPQKEAEDELAKIEKELEATQLVYELDIDHLEAIMRTEVGSGVATMTSKELKRDAYMFAKRDPKLFIEVANDEDIKLRNLANRAVESGILKLTDDNTVFKFANNKKLLTVPFEQHPYTALAQFFKTDEGVDVMKSIVKKLD